MERKFRGSSIRYGITQVPAQAALIQRSAPEQRTMPE